MRRKIYKQKLVSLIEQGVPLMVSGRVIHAGLDPNNMPCVWFENDESGDTLSRVHVAGTGHDVPSGEHVASFREGPFIWHVYAEVKS